ncbi:MAG: MAPEG family protein [Bacteriovoracaceae bacterium]
MKEQSPILFPVMILAAWTMVMWTWMYATRLPAIFKMKMRLDPNAPRGEQMNTLPAKVRWKADNYNHLMEQPTVFYAVAIILAMIGEGGGVNASLAWGYVVLRIIHSLVQAVINKIEWRFFVFILSSLLLFGLVINGLRALV